MLGTFWFLPPRFYILGESRAARGLTNLSLSIFLPHHSLESEEEEEEEGAIKPSFLSSSSP